VPYNAYRARQIGIADYVPDCRSEQFACFYEIIPVFKSPVITFRNINKPGKTRHCFIVFVATAYNTIEFCLHGVKRARILTNHTVDAARPVVIVNLYKRFRFEFFHCFALKRG
jgi:hypothetical protein